MAAYSLVCYVLQIKDRHNANIIVDKDGHVVHIDFGFMLTDAPGQGLEFEAAPFKMTSSFEQILSANKAFGFRRFRENMIQGMLQLNKHAAKIILLVQMCANSQADLSCFKKGGQVAVDELRQRL
jgi:phosphatidylinositol 4-kinase